MQMKNLAVLVALPFALVACGDGGSSSSGGGIVAPGASISSQFIDAPVKGLKYLIGSNSGHTGDNGIFPCKAGEEVTFEVKGRAIGKANCGEKIFIYDLDGTDDQKDAAAMLIQSLAKTTNGVLDLSFFNASSASVDSNLPLATSSIQGTLNTFLTTNNLDTELTTVNLAEAQAHVAESLPDQTQDSVLAGIAAEGPITLSLTPSASNSEDHCWVGVQVKVNLQLIKDKSYRFNVTEYLAYDSETVPSSPVCSTQGGEGGDETGVYECITNPVSKIMTGRTVSGTHYRSLTWSKAKGEMIACNYEDEYEVSENETADGCTQAGGTPVLALDDNNINFGLGYNFNITATDTSYSVSFVEHAVNFVPSKVEGNSVNLTTQPITCSYSLVNDLDLGESLAE